MNNDLNPYKAPLQSNQPGSANANLPEHQADALLNQMADEVYLEKASRAEGVHHFHFRIPSPIYIAFDV